METTRPLSVAQKLTLAIADALARNDEPLTIYDVARYGTIRSLLARGYIERYEEAPNFYRITDAGRTALAAAEAKG
jgi:DNA-binding PadR family transcriptional regulator